MLGDGLRRIVANCILPLIFFGAFLSAVSIGHWAANQVVLRRVYGADVVERQQLRMTEVKPILVVSNGDRLASWSQSHFMILGAILLPLCPTIGLAAWRLLPNYYRSRASSPLESQRLTLGMPLAIAFLLMVWILLYAVGFALAGVALLCLALTTAWLTRP